MSSALPRTFAVIELLVGKLEGVPLGDIATQLDLPKSATHRILSELVELGYVTQSGPQGDYALGLLIVSHALRHLAHIPLVDLAKPLLDRLAATSGELARLSIPDCGELIWVAKTQGARSGLRYDPDAGRAIKLARTSSGMTWLSTMPEQEAATRIEAQGFDDLDQYGPNGPSDLESALHELARVRELGYSYTDSTFELGTATIAVPIRSADEVAVGVLSIAGPSVRLTHERAVSLVPAMKDASEQLALLGGSTSPVAFTTNSVAT